MCHARARVCVSVLGLHVWPFVSTSVPVVLCVTLTLPPPGYSYIVLYLSEHANTGLAKHFCIPILICKQHVWRLWTCDVHMHDRGALPLLSCFPPVHPRAFTVHAPQYGYRICLRCCRRDAASFVWSISFWGCIYIFIYFPPRPSQTILHKQSIHFHACKAALWKVMAALRSEQFPTNSRSIIKKASESFCLFLAIHFVSAIPLFVYVSCGESRLLVAFCCVMRIKPKYLNREHYLWIF